MNSDQILARCPGLTYRMLHYWVGKGWANPTANGTGPGYGWTFSADEARVVEVMAKLAAVGMKPEPAHRAARAALAVDVEDIPAVELAPDVVLFLGNIEALALA